MFDCHSIPRCKPALKIRLSRPDSLPERRKKARPHPHGDPLRFNRLPMGIPASGDRVAEDIIRVLAHAKIGHDKRASVHCAADKAIGEPRQSRDRRHIGCCSQSRVIRGIKSEFNVSVIGDHRVESLEISPVGANNHAPEQRVQRSGSDKHRSIDESACLERLPRLGFDQAFCHPRPAHVERAEDKTRDQPTSGAR